MTTRRLVIAMAAWCTVLAEPAPAPAAGADGVTAEVRTWDGQTWQLGDVALVSFYTGVPEPSPDAVPAPPGASGGAPGRPQARLSGSSGTPRSLFDTRPTVKADPRPSRHVTLYRGGVPTRVAVERMASLIFFRYPIASSPLPPYVASEHTRHAAVAVLTDGSRIDGEYVNLGATFVRGRTAAGDVTIPWTSVEVLRFGR